MLVDRSGSATTLTLVGSGPLTSKATTAYGSVHQSTDGAMFLAYGTLFNQFVADTTVTARTVSAGRHQVLVYPTTADPMAKALKRVKCTDAKGVAVKRGRTNVLVSVDSWSGSRGKELAERLGTLRKQGCAVQVVSGKKVGKGIKRALRNAGVERRAARVSQDTLVVDGRYQKKNRRTIAWVGGPAWTDGALKSDGTQLVLDDTTSSKPYLTAFRQVWKVAK